MIVALFLLSLIGAALISITLGIIITHFVLRVIEALLPLRTPMHHRTTKSDECQSHASHNHPSNEGMVTYHLNIRRYDLYEIIRSRINKMLSDPIENQCRNHTRNANAKEYNRYINRHPPFLAQHPLPFPPIKHIYIIVNKLRRSVNESGKEPRCWVTSICHYP